MTAQKALWWIGKIKKRIAFRAWTLGSWSPLPVSTPSKKIANHCDPGFIAREVGPFFATEIELMEATTGRSLVHWKD